jgi:DNA-binding Lrp family transcriptional regulator
VVHGYPDYLLRVATADIDDYQRVRDHKLATLPGVQRLTSTIVMKRIMADRPFPVKHGNVWTPPGQGTDESTRRSRG